MKKLNIIGEKYNKLLVIEEEKPRANNRMFKCICDCGNITIVSMSNLRANRIVSCGCHKREICMKRSVSHNQRHTFLYEVWKGIKQRCYNSHNKSYHNYGGRGIVVCNEWKDNFQAFYDWSYANGYSVENQKDEKHKLTIDRIDVNGNYEPSNCRWVDRKTQASNMRTTKQITINGETKCLSEWFRVLKVSAWEYYKKIKNGMTSEQALTK